MLPRTIGLTSLFLLLATSSSFAQLRVDDQVPADKKAILAVNVDVNALLKNKLLKSLVDEALKNSGSPAPIKPEDVSKISAFVSAPKGMDPESLQNINYYVYVGFNSTDASAAMKKLMMDEGGREVTVGGKTFIAPPEDEDVGMLVDVQPNYLVVGTEGYLTSPSNQFATKGLAEAYSSLPKTPIRLAIDLDGARTLLDQLSQMANANADFMTKPYVSLIDEVSRITMTSDLNNDSLIKLTISGHNDAEGGKIKQKLDALIGLGKQLSEAMPAGQGSMGPEQLLLPAAKDLEANQSGKDVVIDLKKPAGFEDAMMKAVSGARNAAKRASDMNNLRQILIAMHNYHDVRKSFPFDKHCEGEDSGKGLSGLVYLLPYLEQNALYEKFDLEAPYDAPENAKLGQIVVPTFQLNTGGQFMWVRPTKVCNKIPQILDGTSNTVAFVQSRKVTMAPWTKATSIKPAEVLEQVKALKAGETMLFGMYDGSVRAISNQDDLTDIEAMLEPADGKYPQR